LAWRSLGATWLSGTEVAAAYDKARKAAQTALSLAPNLAEAHEALGWIWLTSDLDFMAAESEFRKAEQLAPEDARPKSALSYLLAAQGQLPAAEEMTRKAMALDPLSIPHFLNLVRVLIAQNRYDEAEATAHKALELQPAAARLHTYLVTIDLLRNKPDAALHNAQQEALGFWKDYARALATQAQGDQAAAEAALQKLIHEDAVAGPFQIAAVYGLRKDPDQMFEWLERAYAQHDSGLTQLLVTPFLLSYKEDPRFTAFCQKLKIPAPTPAAKR
jgi:serine/threonine-protein kinase